MFYTKKHRENMDYLNMVVKDHMVAIHQLKHKLEDHLKSNHPHGTKKDGTPRAKPGRKPA
jgi:hypothetical protein